MLDVESSGNASSDLARVVLLLRIPPSLKTRLAAYARSRGLTLNAAAIVLLGETLDRTIEPTR